MTEQNFKKDKKVSEQLPEISVVVPLFNEAESLRELKDNIESALSDYRFEIIYVDDGSNDDSWQVISDLSNTNDFVKGISLRKNCGKSAALQAGFDHVSGSYVVTMDADLQDDPNEIPKMIQTLKSGVDLVSGWKKERNDPISKTVPSKFFNAVTRMTTKIHLHDFNCGLKAYRREVIENINLYGELHRYVPLLAKWQGFGRIEEQVVKHHPRKHGKTKFGLSRFMNGFLDLITLLFVNRYMQRPMHFFGSIGFVLSFFGVLVNLYLTVQKLVWDIPIGNRPLFFLGILLLVVGVQLFSVGFLGELINNNRVKKFKPPISSKLGL